MNVSRRVFLTGVAALAVFRPKPKPPALVGTYSNTYSNTY